MIMNDYIGMFIDVWKKTLGYTTLNLYRELNIRYKISKENKVKHYV